MLCVPPCVKSSVLIVPRRSAYKIRNANQSRPLVLTRNCIARWRWDGDARCTAASNRGDNRHICVKTLFLNPIDFLGVESLTRSEFSITRSTRRGDSIARWRDSPTQVSSGRPLASFLPDKRERHVIRAIRDHRGDHTSTGSEPAGAFTAREQASKNNNTAREGSAPCSQAPCSLTASNRSLHREYPSLPLSQPEGMASQAGRVRQAAIRSFFTSAQGSRTAAAKVGAGSNGRVEKGFPEGDCSANTSGSAGGRSKKGGDERAEKETPGIHSTMPPSKRVKQQGSPGKHAQSSAGLSENLRESSNPNDLAAYRHAAGSKTISSVPLTSNSSATDWQAVPGQLSQPPPLPPPPKIVSPSPSPSPSPALSAPRPPTRTVVPPLASLLLEPTWRAALSGEFSRPYMRQLQQFLEAEASRGQVVYPPLPAIFQAFNACPLPDVQVVILGQDPYHGPGQAMGLSFSVPRGVPPPSSLQNIFKEMQADGSLSTRPSHGCLLSWAKQGVLLLNTVLSVRAGQANSHAKQGWEQFTDAAIRAVVDHHGRSDSARSSRRNGLLSSKSTGQTEEGLEAQGGARDREGRDQRTVMGQEDSAGDELAKQCPVVFLLWGNHAKAKAKTIPPSSSTVLLSAAHPSGLSAHRGFFGCRHFAQVNEILPTYGHPGINWELDP